MSSRRYARRLITATSASASHACLAWRDALHGSRALASLAPCCGRGYVRGQERRWHNSACMWCGGGHGSAKPVSR
eukprot:353007-Chlamydomonas_euryale.AAC.1